MRVLITSVDVPVSRPIFLLKVIKLLTISHIIELVEITVLL